jgi:hypothetical protein
MTFPGLDGEDGADCNRNFEPELQGQVCVSRGASCDTGGGTNATPDLSTFSIREFASEAREVLRSLEPSTRRRYCGVSALETASIRGLWPVASRNRTRSSPLTEVVMVLTSG